MRVGIDCHFESKIKQGTNTYVSELVESLSREDKINKYFLMNAKYYNTPYKDTAKNLVKRKISTNSTRKNILYGYRKEAQRNKLDILHTNYLCPFFLPCKSVVTIHDILYLSHKKYFPPAHELQLKLLTRLTVRLADRIIAVSEYTKSEIISKFGIEESRIGVTLEAASPKFRLIRNKKRLREEIKLKYGLLNNFILYVGRLAPIKNIPRMLKAFSLYNSKADIKVSFVLVGNFDPVYPDEEIEASIARFKNEHQIIVLNGVSQEDLVKLYNAALVLFFVSNGEGFGLPILEAMNCGTPVITSNVTSCPEIAGDAAMTVAPDDDRKIFEALYNILTSEDLRNQLQQKGAKRASLFSWAKCANETIEQYKACLK